MHDVICEHCGFQVRNVPDDDPADVKINRDAWAVQCTEATPSSLDPLGNCPHLRAAMGLPR